MSRNLRMSVLPTVWTLALTLLAGCGERVTIINSEPEAKAVSDLVEEFNEARGNLKKTSKLFAAGAMPKGAELKKYGRYSYATTGLVKSAGETASMELTISDESTSKESGKFEWTFKKEADGWKIATAPLP